MTLAPVRAGRIGTTSFTLHAQLHRYREAQLIADAGITHVMIEPAAMISIPVPEAIRAVSEGGAPGVLISDAGEQGQEC